MKAARNLVFSLFLFLFFCVVASAQTPRIPVGYDAYRMWARWPYQRIGVRAYMRSTYDRRGGNESADASHFLYQLADDRNATLDVQGPGVLYFARYNHWHGSPWHYEVDGGDHIVKESSTADPLHPVENSTWLPKELFPEPLAFTWSTTKGADLSWVPIGFLQSFRVAYSRTFYGTGYYIFDKFVDGTRLSQPIRPWDEKTPPPKDVLDLLARAGTDIAPVAGPSRVRQESGHLALSGPNFAEVWSRANTAGMIRLLEFSVPKEQALNFSRARLRIFWDGHKDASVDAPVSLFYGAGVLYNRDNREYLVKSLPMVIRYDDSRVYLSCYFPMPFFRSVRIEMAGVVENTFPDVKWTVRYGPFKDPPNWVGYFHATYHDFPSPELGKDLLLLDTRHEEGGGDWSGQFVGTSFIFSHDAVLSTLEGDPRFFFDDSQTPQAQGTGTEEWGGGGDYWGGLNMTLPLAGHPVGAKSPRDARSPEDKIESAYRFLLADQMPFGKNAVIRLEHGGTDESTEHYETVTYWYGLPSTSLVQTDELAVGDEVSEKQHQYASPDASAAYEIESRYEWGPDAINGVEIFPASKDRGRTTKDRSEFVLKIDPQNLGVMLRRKLDYSFPNQRAEVYVGDARRGKTDWTLAGIWYTAGSNTCVYSSPHAELGAALHVVETSNRRFREDEFLIPRKLTRGRSAIHVRVKFTPVSIPLYPGAPMPELAWSEMRYWAYSYVLPRFSLSALGGGVAVRRIPNLRWWIAGLLAVATALNYLDRQSFPVAVKVVANEIPITDRQYAVLQSAFLLAYGLMYAGGGRIVDRLGTRVGYTVIILWWSAANFLHGLATSVMGLGVFRFLLGLGEGGSFPSSAKAVAEWFPPSERAMAFGMFNTGSSLGAVVAPPLIALLIATFGNWRWVFFVTGLFGVVWAMFWWKVYALPSEHRQITPEEANWLSATIVPAGPPVPYCGLFRYPTVWGLMGAKFLSDSAWFFLIFWLPKYLADVRGLNIRQIGYYAWIPYAFSGVGSLAGGALSSLLIRLGYSLNAARKLPLAFSAALMPISLLIVSAPLAFAIVFFSVALFGHQFWSTIIQTLAADFFSPKSVGAVAGLMGAAGSFGAMLFNLLAGGLLGYLHHYGPVFMIVGVLHPISFLILLGSARSIRRLDGDSTSRV